MFLSLSFILRSGTVFGDGDIWFGVNDNRQWERGVSMVLTRFCVSPYIINRCRRTLYLCAGRGSAHYHFYNSKNAFSILSIFTQLRYIYLQCLYCYCSSQWSIRVENQVVTPNLLFCSLDAFISAFNISIYSTCLGRWKRHIYKTIHKIALKTILKNASAKRLQHIARTTFKQPRVVRLCPATVAYTVWSVSGVRRTLRVMTTTLCLDVMIDRCWPFLDIALRGTIKHAIFVA